MRGPIAKRDLHSYWGASAFAVAVVALGVAAYALLKPAPEAVERAEIEDPVARRTAERLADIAERVADLESRPPTAFPPPASPPPSVPPSGIIAELERRVAELERTAPPPPPDPAARAADLRTVVLDAARTLKDRTTALQELRSIPGGRTHEVVVAMLAVFHASKDVGMRREAVRALIGTQDADLVDPLLDALEHDPDDGFREVAAAALEDFLSEPRVLAALRRVVDAPGTPFRVLHQAASTLFKAPK